MDTRSASASPSVVAGPSSLWRLAERRSRKSGSGNIFSTVNLWQLQRLFRAAGDEDAEQRAQLVWGHRDEAELAQALITLRSRGHRRTKRSPESCRHSSFEATSAETGAESVLAEIQNPNGNFDRATATSSGLRRTGESNPERYLHRILH
uniref:Arginine vasopressin-induced protein 1 n=1 Tax=Poecilia latipinna TaxID=48699 RepID=A0A3B3V3S4_9TELE